MKTAMCSLQICKCLYFRDSRFCDKENIHFLKNLGKILTCHLIWRPDYWGKGSHEGKTYCLFGFGFGFEPLMRKIDNTELKNTVCLVYHWVKG